MLFWDFFLHVLALSNPLQFSTTPTSRGSALHQSLVQDRWSSLPQPPVTPPHKNPTDSFWTHGSIDANPLAKEGSDGPLTTDTDIIIIGSGITGVGTAYHLSKLAVAKDLSLNLVILEARDFCENHT